MVQYVLLCMCVCISCVRYRKKFLSWLLHTISPDTTHIAIYSISLSLCIYTDDTCTTDVPEAQYSMVPNYHKTLHTLLSIKIAMYNDIFSTFSSKVYTRCLHYGKKILYIEFFITIFWYMPYITHHYSACVYMCVRVRVYVSACAM